MYKLRVAFKFQSTLTVEVLMKHTMKPWERVAEQISMNQIIVTKNQLGLMHGRSIIEHINIIRQLIK